MNNLHISLTEFRNDSRIMKQASSLASLAEIEVVHIAVLGAPDLKEHEAFGNGVELRRFALRSRGLSKGLLAQAVKYMEFVVRVSLFYRKRDIGMVNVHILGLLPLGYLLKLLYGARLIYDPHELETETHHLSGTRQRLAKWIERRLIGKADQVFVVGENIADWYAATYGIARPTVVMNAPMLYTPSSSNRFRERFGIRDDQIIVLFQGLLGYGRGLESLLAVFSEAPDDRAVIVFMGYGPLEEEIRRVAAGSDPVFFHPAVPPEVVLEYTTSADVGIVITQNTCLSHYFAMPNKLFEYAMAGLPMIVSNMKETREMVERYKMGLVVEEEGTTALRRAIQALCAMDLRMLKINARRAAEENSWEVQEAKMLAAYKKIDVGRKDDRHM